MKILSIDQMRRLEKRCADNGIESNALMENAGRAIAEEARHLAGPPPKSILVLIGPGNNGGDGEVASRYLKGWGYGVVLYLAASRAEPDLNFLLAQEAGVQSISYEDDPTLSRLEEVVRSASLVIDSVYGTGFRVSGQPSRQISERIAAILTTVADARKHRQGLLILSADVPSGVDADTGEIDRSCLAVDESVVLGYPKPGLFVGEASQKAGRLRIVDIGIPDHLATESVAELMTEDQIRPLLPWRPLVSNKGTFGKVLVVAGSVNYVGAAYLACAGAARSGAGLVTLAAPESLNFLSAAKPVEATFLPLPVSGARSSADGPGVVRKSLRGYDCLLIGPGLGQGEFATNLIKSLLLARTRIGTKCVIDADGLTTVARLSTKVDVWRRLSADAILTPHPGEMSKLTGLDIDEVQRERLEIAAKMASIWGKTVVLKGAYTVVASPQGRVTISPFANPALASGGTGDVLAGVIAGLIAQGLPLFDAAMVGVFLHGKAGELVSRRLGDTGAIATDLLPELPVAIKEIKAG